MFPVLENAKLLSYPGPEIFVIHSRSLFSINSSSFGTINNDVILEISLFHRVGQVKKFISVSESSMEWETVPACCLIYSIGRRHEPNSKEAKGISTDGKWELPFICL